METRDGSGSERDESKLGSLFIQNSQTFDFGDMQKFYLEKEWEYEKRSVSSLLIGSGGGLSLILANARVSEGFLALTPIISATVIVFFLLSLLLAGASQFILNEPASLNHKLYTMKSNHQSYVQSIGKFDKLKKINDLICFLVPTFETDNETNADNRFKILDRANVAKNTYIKLEKKASKFEKAASLVLLLSSIFFFVSIIFVVTAVIWNIL